MTQNALTPMTNQKLEWMDRAVVVDSRKYIIAPEEPLLNYKDMRKMQLKLLLSALFALAVAPSAAEEYLNVYGETLQPCSAEGMALTGFTRTGYCVDQNDDTGSHHICIDLSSANGGNFCDVTGQEDWCSSEMPCDGDADSYCQVQQWCACQWAFASYLENAGGCDEIQDIVCASINLQAVWAYQGAGSSSKYSKALECLVDRCGLDMTNRNLYSGGSRSNGNAAITWLGGAGMMVLAALVGAAVVLWKKRATKKDALLPKPENAPEVRYQSTITGTLA